MLQLVPMLARCTAEAPTLRLNARVVLLPLSSPLHVDEEFVTLDVMSGGKLILGVGLGYRDDRALGDSSCPSGAVSNRADLRRGHGHRFADGRLRRYLDVGARSSK